jgi:hypothetical protein
MNNIELKAIKDLLEMNFFIPDYQRGYRWTRQQIKDLLDDIQEFMENNSKNIYCIQPLVVKRVPVQDGLLNQIRQAPSIDDVRRLINMSDVWEVIDGQQRLTTIYIILKYLQHGQLYTLKYETRKDSWDYLKNSIVSYKSGDTTTNIDFYHMGEAYCVVKEWFSTIKNRDQFIQTLLERVKFIWYEVQEDQNSKEIFQRLNLGKISLTNSELIKAIFLKRNYNDSNEEINTTTMQVSTEWDIIENALQNDELWAFVNTLDYESPTRIDYIFDIIRARNILQQSNTINDGDDEYSTFRYFYAYLRDKKDLREVWSKVYEVYDILNEWYNTSNLYHYIGFIIASTKNKSCDVVSRLIEKWIDESVSKEVFIKKYLVNEIKKICKLDNDKLEDFLNKKSYDMEGCPSKTECRPILLLHNIETIVQQNRCVDTISKFGNVFYRFPFHQYKASRKYIGWDVEHIDSSTENELRNQKDRIEYLKLVYLSTEDEDIKQAIRDLMSSSKDEVEIDDKVFGEIRSKVTNDKNLEGEDKNKIWNFALLDSRTNRGYGNSPFPAKRRVIIGKERGLKYSLDIKDNFKENSSPESATFIPPCTRNVFLKYYTTSKATNLTAWLKEDAKAYRDDMLRVIGKFLEMAQ